MKKVLVAAVVALTLSAPAKAETWFTIVSDRGCIISSGTPLQFEAAVNAKDGGPTHADYKYWDDGRLMFIDVWNVDANGVRNNQYFFDDVDTCMAASKIMGVAQQ